MPWDGGEAGWGGRKEKMGTRSAARFMASRKKGQVVHRHPRRLLSVSDAKGTDLFDENIRNTSSDCLLMRVRTVGIWDATPRMRIVERGEAERDLEE